MNIKRIAGLLAPLAAGVAMAGVVSLAPAANAATVQFTATVQAPNRILTTQPVYVHEHLSIGGFGVTVTGIQSGGKVAFLSRDLPSTSRVLSPVVVKVG